MTHTPASKRFAALATSWKRDEFFSARLALTGIYAATVAVILGIFSYLLYNALANGISDSFDGNFATQAAQQLALNQVMDILQTRLLIADGIVLLVVVVVGFFLTTITLRPLRKARARERRFLADAAHELRTPLTIMKTDTEVLLRDRSATIADTKELLKKNIDEIDVLAGIANGLLDLVRTENKKNAVSFIMVGAILTRVVDKFMPLARARDISLTASLEVGSETMRVRGSAEALERAFANSIENALKYTESGGQISVSLERKEAVLEIKIKDTGCGIASEDLPFVTEPFYRADTARASVSGSGLGLTIIKETMETHSGKLHIESVLGEGTIVYISLPLAA
ncbi:MAG: sensor histidine kinase [Minisyncoccota bacterium]